MPDGSAGFRTPLWRAIAAYRFAALAYLAFLLVRNVQVYRHPLAALPVFAVAVVWTVFVAYAYATPSHRRWPLLLADLLVTMGVLIASVPVIGAGALQRGTPTLSVAWHVAPVLAWAVAGGRRQGLAAAAVMGLTDVFVRGHFDQVGFTGAILMMLAAFSVGYLVGLADDAERKLQRAAELEAATRERERLARDIHDSVLQVLALVQRRGAVLDGEAGDLARMAGEQEAALRALVTGRQTPIEPGTLDLRDLIGPLASSTVSVASPAGPVTLPAPMARDVTAAVAAALDNVVQHCSPGTVAWVLIEDEPGAVTVSVRDDGPGIADGRLAEAEGQGRLGVAQSIVRRIADLGGTATVTAAPGDGTEVEMVIPRSREGAWRR
jgi:signal transduction histidine kinase